jgi:hypothetical protein
MDLRSSYKAGYRIEGIQLAAETDYLCYLFLIETKIEQNDHGE